MANNVELPTGMEAKRRGFLGNTEKSEGLGRVDGEVVRMIVEVGLWESLAVEARGCSARLAGDGAFLAESVRSTGEVVQSCPTELAGFAQEMPPSQQAVRSGCRAFLRG